MSIPDPQVWLAAIVDSSDDAIVGKTLESIVVSWNKAAIRIFGYTAEEMIGRSILTIFPPELVHEETMIVSKLSRGERIEHFESQRLRKDGTRIDVSVSVSPILDNDGRIVGAAKIARDVTEARRMQRSLRILNDQLEQQASELRDANQRLANAASMAKSAQEESERANRAKSDFLASMSHELRTPLNAISGYADLMDAGVAGDLPRIYRDYVDKIQRSQRHLQQLISEVLDFSKLESGTLNVELGDVPVAELLDQVEPLVAPQARAKDQTLTIVRPNATLLANADEDRALQVLLNLVSNAIKFTSARGSIAVEAERSGDSIFVHVRDSGPGIPPQDSERVFEPFVQLDRSFSRRKEGTGLGLAISRDLARAMGGDVVLQSTPGRGSTFSLKLGVSVNQPAQIHPSETARR